MQKRQLFTSFLTDDIEIAKENLFTIAEKFLAEGKEHLFKQFLYEIYGKEFDADLLSFFGDNRLRRTRKTQKTPEKGETEPQLGVKTFSSPKRPSRMPLSAKKRDEDIYRELGNFLEGE
jgi:hypothetical protein